MWCLQHEIHPHILLANHKPNNSTQDLFPLTKAGTSLSNTLVMKALLTCTNVSAWNQNQHLVILNQVSIPLDNHISHKSKYDENLKNSHSSIHFLSVLLMVKNADLKKSLRECCNWLQIAFCISFLCFYS